MVGFSEKLLVCFLLSILPTISSRNGIQVDSASCPQLWTVPANGTESGECKCGADLHRVILCNAEHNISLLKCWCMTYNEATDEVYVGYCLYTCYSVYVFDRYHEIQTNDKLMLNEEMCGQNDLHRTGQMCGQCEDEYGFPVYSYSLKCVKCSDYKYNWLKYIAIAYLPLTVFYILVITLRVAANSGTLNAYILISQLFATPALLRIFNNISISEEKVCFFKSLTSMYAIWNLDIFRSLYKPFCLHPNLSAIQILSLDYIIAVYPLFLILITYLCVVLHDRYSLMVWLWKPFYFCLARFRREWDIRNSLLSSFATFLLLSYLKIVNTSIDLLTPSYLYTVEREIVNVTYLYYDSTTQWFGKEHLPFAILAIFMSFLFNVLPLIFLLLYPCHCFHKCLTICRLQYQILHAFADVFQGNYRTAHKIYRCFAGFYLLIRIINLLCFSFNLSVTSVVPSAYLSIISAMIVALVRPHRVQCYNSLDVMFLILIGLFYFTFPCNVYLELINPIHNQYTEAMITIMVLIPPLYGFGVAVYRIVPKKYINKIKRSACSNCYDKRNEYDRLPSDSSIPHRIVHAEEYPPLIHVNIAH